MRVLHRLLGHVLRELVERRPVETRLVLEIAAHDQLLLGMSREPARAAPHQLLDLRVVHPVVLVVVEDGQEDVEVVEEVCEPELARQAKADVAPGPPLRKGWIEQERLHGDLVSEWLEQPAHDLLAAARRHDRELRLERNGRRGELRPLLAGARHGALEDVYERNAHERRGDVGAVVYVLGQCEGGTGSPAAHEPDRIDVQEERGRTASLRDLRVEHVRLSERHAERLHAVRVLVQQVPEVSCGTMRRRDVQEHAARSR